MFYKSTTQSCLFVFTVIITLPALCFAVGTPTLKWQYGGCYSSWCETGWYSSPAVADLDGDGTMEVIAAAYSVYVINGEDGTLQNSRFSTGQRSWPGVVVADIDDDGDLEFITAHNLSTVYVFDHLGNVDWSVQEDIYEFRGLSAFDIDNDGTMEIVATQTGDGLNTWIYEHDGTTRTGWPQKESATAGSSWGVFNDNAAIGDLDGDSIAEIIVPSDAHYICAYDPAGNPLQTNSMFGNKVWGQIGTWYYQEYDIQGWGDCSSSTDLESFRSNFANSPAVISDVDEDGLPEIVVTGNTYDCYDYTSQYIGVYIFNADRSRFHTGEFNWETVPFYDGAPLSEDYGVIEKAMPNPVVADLDGDGYREILFSSYDGKVHAFWLDKAEHGHWPYSVYNSSAGYLRFASEPIVVDLENDGYAEVIFTSWTEKESGQNGILYILDSRGDPLYEVELPDPLSPSIAHGNGGMAAPTIANIDDDSDFEVIVNTTYGGVVAYDLPDSSSARILWGTGRGSYTRNGMSAVEMKSCGGLWRRLGDFDGDCDIDNPDFQMLAERWLTSDPLTDIAPSAGDSTTNLLDLSVLCENWLIGAEP